MSKDITRSVAYQRVKEALTSALEVQGKADAIRLDKVQEYMDFWVQRQQLRQDVADRGLVLTDERGRVTENRSVALGVQVARQMMDILRMLDVARVAEDMEEL